MDRRGNVLKRLASNWSSSLELKLELFDQSLKKYYFERVPPTDNLVVCSHANEYSIVVFKRWCIRYDATESWGTSTPHFIHCLCTIWLRDDKCDRDVWMQRNKPPPPPPPQKKNAQIWSRMWAGLQCAVNTLHIDAPWRMFSQVITLCGRPHSQHSVIYPSDRNPVSRMCLWFNQLRQADDVVFMTAT